MEIIAEIVSKKLWSNEIWSDILDDKMHDRYLIDVRSVSFSIPFNELQSQCFKKIVIARRREQYYNNNCARLLNSPGDGVYTCNELGTCGLNGGTVSFLWVNPP